MAEFTGYSQVAGIIVPFENYSLDTSAWNFVDLGPGTPTIAPTSRNASTTLAVRTSGTQTVDEQLVITQAGPPGVGRGTLRAASYYDGNYYGAHATNILSYVENYTSFDTATPTFSPGLGAAINTQVFLPLPSVPNSVLCAQNTIVQRYTSGSLGIAAIYRDADYLDNPIAADTVIHPDSVYSAVGGFSRDNQVTIYYVEQDHARAPTAVDRDYLQLWAARSEDSGKTWNNVAKLAFSDYFPNINTFTSVIEISAACDDRGRVLLILVCEKKVGDDYFFDILHFASIDGGLNFSLVAHYDGTGFDARSVACVSDGEVYHVAWVEEGATYLEHTRFLTITSPYTRLDSVPAVDIAGTYAIAPPTKITLTILPSGTLTIGTNADYAIWAYESTDAGLTWQADAPMVAWDSSDYSSALCAAPSSGRIIWGLGLVSSAGLFLADDRILILESGGWTSASLPRRRNSSPAREHGWGSQASLLPFGDPVDQGWLNSGGATAAAAAPYYTPNIFISTSTYIKNYTDATFTSGIIVRFRMETDTTTFAENGIKVRLGNGGSAGNLYLAIYITATQIRVFDIIAGGAVGTFARNGQLWGQLAMSRIGATAKAVLYTSENARLWTAQAQLTPVYDLAVANTSVEIGVFSGTSSPSFGYIGVVPYSGSRLAGAAAQVYDDLAMNPTAYTPWHLLGAALPVRGYSETQSGLRLSGAGGLGSRGDVLRIVPVAANPPENLLMPSPRAYAEFNPVVADTDLGIDLGANITVGPAIGIAVDGCAGFKTASLALYDSGTATYLDVGVLDLTLGLVNLDLTVYGSSLVAHAPYGGTVSRYVAQHELAGATLFSSTGAAWKISSNSAGWIGGAQKQAAIFLEQKGTMPTSGTFSIAAKRGFCVISQLAAYTVCSTLRIRIPQNAAFTLDAAKIGTMVVGPYLPFATAYSHGRVLESTPGTVTTTTEAGFRHVAVSAPVRRAVQYGWVEGVDTTGVSGAGSDHISIPTGSVLKVGIRGDTSIMEGIVRATASGSRPLAYAPKLITNLSSWAYADEEEDPVYQGGHDVLIGRVVGSQSRDSVLGAEGTSEVQRISTIRIEEEI